MHVAIKLRHLSRLRPMSIWPLVHPHPALVPKPTNKPATKYRVGNRPELSWTTSGAKEGRNFRIKAEERNKPVIIDNEWIDGLKTELYKMEENPIAFPSRCI